MNTCLIAPSTPTPPEGYLISLQHGSPNLVQVQNELTIGRDRNNQLVLTDPFISSYHARVEKRPHGYFVHDLLSSNGTYINGVRVQEGRLTHQDRVRFGETVFVFSESAHPTAPTLQSRNAEWNEQLQRLPTFAATDFPVLITGPSGCGKEVLARHIHQQSARAQQPFITLNCGALNEGLIESELFGHVKGSFTGAASNRKGAFEAARGGTLFLDEIGDLPLTLQPQLLRALENREIRPVGSDQIIETDVRIIAATHMNLTRKVQSHHFREDLFYRLNVCRIHPPALRDRLEDFENLLAEFSTEHKVQFSLLAVETLKRYDWPGNIRELRNTVARAAAYFPSRIIQEDEIETIVDRNLSLSHLAFEAEQKADRGFSLIKQVEREMIVKRLIANEGNQKLTAADLGLPKSTLHDKIHRYKINLHKIREEAKNARALAQST